MEGRKQRWVIGNTRQWWATIGNTQPRSALTVFGVKFPHVSARITIQRAANPCDERPDPALIPLWSPNPHAADPSTSPHTPYTTSRGTTEHQPEPSGSHCCQTHSHPAQRGGGAWEGRSQGGGAQRGGGAWKSRHKRGKERGVSKKYRTCTHPQIFHVAIIYLMWSIHTSGKVYLQKFKCKNYPKIHKMQKVPKNDP